MNHAGHYVDFDMMPDTIISTYFLMIMMLHTYIGVAKLNGDRTIKKLVLFYQYMT